MMNKLILLKKIHLLLLILKNNNETIKDKI
jgi:hypothetical protein